MVTHDAEVAAIASRRLLLDEGKFVEQNTDTHLKSSG